MRRLPLVLAAGPGRGRPLEATCRRRGDRVELSLAASKQTTGYAGEYLALASAILRREGGDVRCGPERIVVWIPVAMPVTS